MSLQYKIEAYLRQAMRGQQVASRSDGTWSASLPEFGLTATADTVDDAESKLYVMLHVYVEGAREFGYRLPVMDDIDLSEEPTREQAHAIDALAEQAIEEYLTGQTVDLRQYAVDHDIAL